MTSARDFSEGGERVTWGRTFQAEEKATQRPEVGACQKGASSAEIGGAIVREGEERISVLVTAWTI